MNSGITPSGPVPPHRPCGALEREGLDDDAVHRFILGSDERPIKLSPREATQQLGDRFAQLVLLKGVFPRTAREVLAEVASRPAFLLDGLVHATATLLTGPPKSGKTFLVVEWIEALTAGQEWHGRQVGAPTRVLVLPTDPDGFGEYAGRLCPDVLDEVELAHPPKPGDLDG